MRPLFLATLTLVTALGAGQADAQRYRGGGSGPGAPYPVPGNTMPAPPAPVPQMQRPPMNGPGRPYPGPRPVNQPDRHRWGGSVGGRWQGGLNAPGGWNAYHRPSRGYRMPSYWFSPNFFIGDYSGYGLSAPPAGYGWYRYYDDAVLLDQRGRVYDSVDGLDWDGGYDDRGYGPGGYDQAGGYGRPYPPQPYPAPLPPIVQNGGVTTYSTTSGYAGGYGYAYPGATTTVVTIQSAPIVTTTTTEYVETVRERQVYRAARKRYYRPVRRKPICRPVEQPVLGS
jgi:Ni/Co efflux regulator RcnB